MKYVKTNRAKLAEVNYPMSVLDLPRNRDFYASYPAPINFNIQTGTKSILAPQLQTLAIWFCRGTTLTFGGKILKTKLKPVDQWLYQFVDIYPKHYSLMGKNTPDLAYAYGKSLIAACTKASNIPFPNLELAYKTIMRALWKQVIVYSPNEKTYLEVKAEMQALEEIQALTYASEEAMHSVNNYTDETLAYYAKIFGVSIPDWSIKQTPVKTAHHGFAMLPQIEMNSYYQMTFQKAGEAGYAGNEERESIPYTLLKDSIPIKLNNIKLRAQITEQLDWYQTTYAETHDDMLLAEGWAHCNTCGFYQTTIGCECGTCLSLEEKELKDIREAYAGYQSFAVLAQDANGNFIQ